MISCCQNAAPKEENGGEIAADIKTAAERGAKTQICGGEKHTVPPRCKRVMPPPRRDARESCRRPSRHKKSCPHPAEMQESHAAAPRRHEKVCCFGCLVFGKQKTKPAYIKIGAPTAPRSGFEKGSDICQTIMPSFSCSFSSAAVSISESASPRAK